MTSETTIKLIMQTSKVDIQIESKRDKSTTSSTETTRRNCKRIWKITYLAALTAAAVTALTASTLSAMLRLPKKMSRSSGKVSSWRNSWSDDDVVMTVVTHE